MPTHEGSNLNILRRPALALSLALATVGGVELASPDQAPAANKCEVEQISKQHTQRYCVTELVPSTTYKHTVTDYMRGIITRRQVRIYDLDYSPALNAHFANNSRGTGDIYNETVASTTRTTKYRHGRPGKTRIARHLTNSYVDKRLRPVLCDKPGTALSQPSSDNETPIPSLECFLVSERIP